MYIYIYICIYVYMYLCMICTCIYMYVCMYHRRQKHRDTEILTKSIFYMWRDERLKFSGMITGDPFGAPTKFCYPKLFASWILDIEFLPRPYNHNVRYLGEIHSIMGPISEKKLKLFKVCRVKKYAEIFFSGWLRWFIHLF